MRNLALFFTFFIAAMCIQGQEIEIPAWVDHEVNETFARFNEWRGDDQVVVFPIQTDVHSGGRDTYRHVAYVNHAANTFGSGRHRTRPPGYKHPRGRTGVP